MASDMLTCECGNLLHTPKERRDDMCSSCSADNERFTCPCGEHVTKAGDFCSQECEDTYYANVG